MSVGGPAWFLAEVLDPGLAWLAGLGGPPVTPAARRMLLAIAMQESGLRHRAQVPVDHAHGWWQFERGGGVTGVLRHPATAKLASACCAAAVVEPEPAAVWRALEGHDRLATAFARLLLWTDPHPLPATEAEGWDCYLRLWRPGKPRPAEWPENWRAADELTEKMTKRVISSPRGL